MLRIPKDTTEVRWYGTKFGVPYTWICTGTVHQFTSLRVYCSLTHFSLLCTFSPPSKKTCCAMYLSTCVVWSVYPPELMVCVVTVVHVAGSTQIHWWVRAYRAAPSDPPNAAGIRGVSFVSIATGTMKAKSLLTHIVQIVTLGWGNAKNKI